MGSDGIARWQDVLWRQWRHTRDEGLAALIWDALADESPTDEARSILNRWVHGVMAAVGAMVGLMVSALFLGSLVGPDQDALVFGVLAAGIVAGAVGGWAYSQAEWRRAVSRASTWRQLYSIANDDLSGKAAMRAAFGPLWPGARETDASYAWSATGMPYRAAREYIPWWSDPPGHSELLAALRHPDAPEWAHQIAEPIDTPDPRALCEDLVSEDAVTRWRAHLALLELEGRAVPAVAEAMEHGRIGWKRGMAILGWVSERTLARFGQSMPHLVCPACFASMRRLKPGVPLSRNPEYIACRSCGQSREAIAHGGAVVCVLDSSDDRACRSRDGTLRVNWLALARASDFEGQALFDFERVEIVAATDDEVRHFLVDVSSDTDPERRKRYRRMHVTVSSACALSPNTLRALRECFPGM